MPSSNPTTGLGVAAYITLSGSSGSSVITNPSGGTAANGSGSIQGTNGQGVGANAGKSGTESTTPGFPVGQYACTLSVSAAGGYATTLAVTAALVDVINAAYTPAESGALVVKSYNNPSAGSPSWYRPSNFAGYSADVVSAAVTTMSASDEVFTITALNPGQAIVEAQFPVFDNTLGVDEGSTGTHTGNPTNMIFVQVIVTVIP